jgi:voltage-gated potassium channel
MFGQDESPGKSRFLPHGLLALVVGLYGLKNVFPIFDQIKIIKNYLKVFGPAEDFAHLPVVFHIPGGVPQTVIGLIQILMSIGLLLRSRFAWVVTLLLAVVSLLFIVHQHPLSTAVLTMNILLLAILLIFRKTFDRSSLTTGSFFSLLSILLLTAYAVFGSYILGRGFTPPITSLVTAFYFSVITMATVGYGDIVPHSDDARIFVVSLVLLGITVFSAAISSILIPVINDRLKKILLQEKRKMPRKNHYILVGTSNLARSVYRELDSRKLPVTVIVPQEVKDPPFDLADQVIGDPADGETLKKAGALDALAILSLLEDDPENAFVVLAAREIGSKARTVVSVRDRVNFSRIRSVSPDMVLSPEVIGGELIAMALNNEKIDGEAFFKKALFLDRRMEETREPSS